jgi:hypothetical protein
MVSFAPWPLYPSENRPAWEGGWAPEPFMTPWQRENIVFLPLQGIELRSIPIGIKGSNTGNHVTVSILTVSLKSMDYFRSKTKCYDERV